MSTAGVPRARSLQLLAGPDRIRFLARLAGSLVLAARGEYVEAGQSVDRAWVALRAVNEMVLVISAQLTSAAEGRDPAYPDAASLMCCWGKLMSASAGMPWRGPSPRRLRLSAVSVSAPDPAAPVRRHRPVCL